MQLKLGCKKTLIKIVGLKYGERVPSGTTLRLVEDNNNQYDPDAVMVITNDGKKVGYVANNKQGTLKNKFYNKFSSATELRKSVNLDETFVCGNIDIKGGYGLMKITI